MSEKRAKALGLWFLPLPSNMHKYRCAEAKSSDLSSVPASNVYKGSFDYFGIAHKFGGNSGCRHCIIFHCIFFMSKRTSASQETKWKNKTKNMMATC